MGFLSSALMNVGTGALEQLNQNYNNDNAEQDQLMRQRQTVVDQVDRQQSAMDNQANNIATNQKRIMGTLGVTDPDKAYYLAQLNIKCPDKEMSIANRMQATGGQVPASPGGPSGNVTQGQGNPQGRQWCPINGFSPSVPPVQGPQMRPQPARRAFTITPPIMDNTPKMGPFPAPTTPEQAAAWQRIQKAGSTANADPNDLALAGGKQNAGQIPPAEKARLQLNLISQVHNKVISSEQAGVIAKANNLSPYDYSKVDTKVPPDPVYIRRVNAMAQGWANEFQGVTLQAATTAAAHALAGGAIEPTQFNGNKFWVDATDGHTPVDANWINKIAGLLHPDNVKNPPPPAAASTTAQQNNQGTVNQSSTNAAPGQPQIVDDIAKSNVPSIQVDMSRLSKQEQETTPARMNATPKMLANLAYIQAMADRDPQALGITGQLVKHFGGPLENIVGLASPKTAQDIDKFINFGQRQGLDAAVNVYQVTMMRPLLNAYGLSGSMMGAGGREGNDRILSFLEHGDWHSNVQGFTAQSAAMKDMLLSNYAQDYLDTHKIPPNLQQSLNGSVAVLTDLVNHGFTIGDARTITEALGNKQVGAAPIVPGNQ